jgi:hypothetical protein
VPVSKNDHSASSALGQIRPKTAAPRRSRRTDDQIKTELTECVPVSNNHRTGVRVYQRRMQARDISPIPIIVLEQGTILFCSTSKIYLWLGSAVTKPNIAVGRGRHIVSVVSPHTTFSFWPLNSLVVVSSRCHKNSPRNANSCHGESLMYRKTKMCNIT